MSTPQFQMHKEKLLVFVLLGLMVFSLALLEFVELDADTVVRVTTGLVVVFALVMILGVVIRARKHLRRKEEYARELGLDKLDAKAESDADNTHESDGASS